MLSFRLDSKTKPDRILAIENSIKNRIVGQDSAIENIVGVVQNSLVGIHNPNKPLGSMLLLGSTGIGKTETVGALSKALFGTSKAVIRIDCAEYQMSQDISKIIGAPPGYVGHNSTEPIFTQPRLEQHKTKDYDMNIILFDEIEKASDALFKLLLGIMDYGILKTNQNKEIDFSRSLIFLTSNLGAEQIKALTSKGLGFNPAPVVNNETKGKITNSIQKSVEKQFSPEFIGRLSKIITFENLTEENVKQILQIELDNVKKRIFTSANHCKFTFFCDSKVQEFLVQEGYSPKYGARNLTKAVEKHIVTPLANLMLRDEIEYGDALSITWEDDEIQFNRLPAEHLVTVSDNSWESYKRTLEESACRTKDSAF
jgi:ATP-dependent Clp protease ATP-binding subunit ClpB